MQAGGRRFDPGPLHGINETPAASYSGGGSLLPGGYVPTVLLPKHYGNRSTRTVHTDDFTWSGPMGMVPCGTVVSV